MCWKKIPSWLKGGIIGGIISIILMIILFLFTRVPCFDGRCINLIQFDLFGIVFFPGLLLGLDVGWLILLMSIIFYVIVGILIGYIVGMLNGKRKIKQKKRVKRHGSKKR
jgi:hypothetical protein